MNPAEQALPPPHPRMEKHPVSETLCSLKYQTKCKNPVIYKCYDTSVSKINQL
jgi:hypothetical protein